MNIPNAPYFFNAYTTSRRQLRKCINNSLTIPLRFFIPLCFLAAALSGCGADSDNKTSLASSPTPPVVGNPDVIAPATTTDLSALSLSISQIQLSWTAPGDDDVTGTATGYDIRYRLSPINDSNWASSTSVPNVPDPQTAGVTQTVLVSGLNENTEYYFAMKAVDEESNESARSNTATATTDAEPPPLPDTTAPAMINNLSATVQSTSSIQLNWSAPGDDDNTGTAQGYDLRYANSEINNSNWDGASQVSGESVPGVAGSAQSFTVTGLNASTQYYFAIKTTDDAGNESVLSNVVSGTTLSNTSAAATVPGAISSPYPTVQHLSIEWLISGDNDEDGIVSVRYRAVGDATWKIGMNLFRVVAGSNQGFSWAEKHSGSLFSLAPDTEYQIELTLNDPDNGAPIIETLNARTRAIPQAAADANVIEVTPATFSNALGAVSAGDVLLLSSGTYPGFSVDNNGSANQPIVIRGTNKNNVIINGDVRMDNRHDVYLESVTVNGLVKFNSSENIVVRGTNVNTNGHGIVAQGSGTINAYIVDNAVIGATAWGNNTVGNNGDNIGEGIELTGPGNVIAYNYVKGFRDGISLLEDGEAVNQVSFDIYNNDIEIGADDGIEADFAMGNVRVLNNRITNSYVGLSSQPSLGGPTYFIGNVLYNVVYTPFKLHRGSVGDVAIHNTVVKAGDAFGVFTDDVWSHAYFRNNLFIGGAVSGEVGPFGIGDGDITDLRGANNTCTFDHDGFGSIGTARFSGRIGDISYSSLSALRTETTETHAQQVDMSIFASTVTFPSTVFPERTIPDLRLTSGNNAINTGIVIPNINDGFQGSAPDLGAYELGSNLPIYGPRI